MNSRISALLSRHAAPICAAAIGILSFSATGIAAVAQSPLINGVTLQKMKSDPNLVLLYVGPKEGYEAGHIEGSRYITLQDISVEDKANKLNLELPTESELRDRLEKFGISDRSKIVVVPGQEWNSPATRVMWTLQVAGLGAQSFLLDGGTEGWAKGGQPLTKDAPTVKQNAKLTLAQHRELVVDYQWMQAHLNSPKVKVIDGRAPVFYEGAGMKHEGMPDAKAGHVPGAANIPFNILAEDGSRLLAVDSLRKIFKNAGVQPGDTVAAYCHVGQQATYVLFAARLLGNPIRLYDGSMNDWENRKLPVVNEKAPI